MTTSTQVRLARRPQGEPDDATYSFVEHELPAIGEGQLLLRVVYLSLDPYMRGRMSDAKSYADPVEIGDVLVAGTVCVVEESRHPDYEVGRLVLSYSGWQTHAGQRRHRPAPARPRARAGLDRARRARACPASRRTPDCWRSAGRSRARPSWSPPPPGPVGSAVGQIAKVKGARAVGIAGGETKRRALLEEFGFDVALDHRSPTFADDLAAAVPDGIDVYFENVGGTVAREVFKPDQPATPGCPCAAWSPTTTRTAAPEGPDRLPGFMGLVLRQEPAPCAASSRTSSPRSHGRDFVRDMSGWIAERQGALPRGRRRGSRGRPGGVPRAAHRPQLRQAACRSPRTRPGEPDPERHAGRVGAGDGLDRAARRARARRPDGGLGARRLVAGRAVRRASSAPAGCGPPPDSDEWHMLYRFADHESLDAWESSPQREWWLGSAQGLVGRVARWSGVRASRGGSTSPSSATSRTSGHRPPLPRGGSRRS